MHRIFIYRLCSERDSVERVCREKKWNNLLVQEWESLELLKKLLEPFDAFTTLTSAQNYTTCDLYVSALRTLEIHLTECIRNDFQSPAATVLLDELKRRFDRFLDPTAQNHIPFYVAACFLHPLLRHLLSDTAKNSAKQFIKEVHTKYFEVCKSHNNMDLYSCSLYLFNFLLS